MDQDPETLKRIDENLQKLSKTMRGVRKTSGIKLGGLPLYSIAFGPDLDAGESRGLARGIIAIGDMAKGVIAIGGFATGFLAIGGLAVGVIAFGGGAIGGLAIGGGAFGVVAWGGGAVGYYADGGGAAGKYVLSATRRDPEAVTFFKKWFPACMMPPDSRWPNQPSAPAR